MGEFLSLLLQWLEKGWPFRRIDQWERGGYYVCGRYKRQLGPGVYPVIPWFTDVLAYSVVPELIETGRQDITLSDGTGVSYSISAWIQLVDFDKAVNTVGDHERTTKELVRAVCADRIANVDPARLKPEGRGRLIADLRRWVDEEASQFGMKVERIRFTSFVTNVKTFRLLQEVWT